MGLVARQLGRLDEAEKLLRASSSKKLILRDGDPNVPTTQRALADVLVLRDIIRALKQMRRAAGATEEALLDAEGDGDA